MSITIARADDDNHREGEASGVVRLDALSLPIEELLSRDPALLSSTILMVGLRSGRRRRKREK